MEKMLFSQKPGSREIWQGLAGSSSALAIAKLMTTHDSLFILITQDTPTALRFKREIEFFSSNLFSQSISEQIAIFPDWEILPYDNFSPHQDIVSERIKTLFALQSGKLKLLILPVTTLMSRTSPQNFINQHSMILEVGQTLDRENYRQTLVESGYYHVNEVMEHGEFSIRGSIIDVFPMGSLVPFRIDLFDDEIDTIREFDSETQRSGAKHEAIRLLSGREFPTHESAISLFRRQWRNQFEGTTDCPIYQQVSEGTFPAGIEFYFPLFFEKTATLFDFIPDSAVFITIDDIESSSQKYWQECEARYEERRHDRLRPILSPQQLFLRTEEIFSGFKAHARIQIDTENRYEKTHWDGKTELTPELEINHKLDQPFTALLSYADNFHGTVVICTETAGRRESLLELMQRHQLQPKLLDNDWTILSSNQSKLMLCTAPIFQGFTFELSENKIALITESQLLGRRVLQQRRQKKTQAHHENIVRNLAELQIGEPIVHVEMGVGRYLGLQTISVGAQISEFLTIEYAGDDKLYVPVHSLHLIARYSAGQVDNAPLHKLGTEQWTKAKKRAAEKARDVAAELLDIYARRESKLGFACKSEKIEYEKFAASFPFEETPDQQTAIQAVIDDLRSNRVMDRLVCGDVGFGKTEVAMRAAFIAVNSGAQVVLLAPTTLLAQQHYETLRDRFADWPFRIEVLSRFTQSKNTQSIKDDVACGKVDIIVGTHKLLQPDVKFNNLSLVIIDEEHRFGVRQKDRLKSLRSDVNILTLTATPIPRTLNMSFSGMRDLSIITTPPAKRLAIKTFVREKNTPLIREAVLREIMRGGQVYYLHNQVDTIEKTAADLAELIPEARIAIAHGQMRERELERVMQDFYHQRYNLLICTTIIETGIDVPTANTIIMDRADKLGLAQMHQLRGRVGRSHHQAYAYLMIPNEKTISKDATKRLDAIASAETLGAGFTLATHDLEIRGAGELLGDEQSGHIQTIGFSLFMELLDRAVKSIKQGKEPDFSLSENLGCEVDLKIPALLPEDYIPDVNTRLSLYKRIASSGNDSELDDLQVELIDRFGLLPENAKNLFTINQLKIIATSLGIRKVDVGAGAGRIEFDKEPLIDPSQLILMIQKQPDRFRLDGPKHLKFFGDMENNERRLASTRELLETLDKMKLSSSVNAAVS